MPLEFKKHKALREVMTARFITVADFRTFLSEYVGRNLDRIEVGTLDNVISSVITAADGQEWLGDLLEGLKEVSGPAAKATLDTIDITGHFGVPQSVAYRTNVAKLVQNAPALEKIVRDTNSFLPIETWLSRAIDIRNRVCRFSFDIGRLLPVGSGFLVAPDVVLTNHHVVASVINGIRQAKQIRVQFDHYELTDGSVSAGTIVQTAEKWLIASAPHDPVDITVHDLTTEPNPANLDFALVRLERKIGDENARDRKRGWLDLETTAENARAGAPAFIAQYPGERPMQLALDTGGVIGYSPNELRLRYHTNTLGGSSGAPVFNQDWELLALHHAGDPEYPELDTGKYNEGIPIRTLTRHLRGQNILAQL